MYIIETKLGPTHPRLATILNLSADVHRKLEAYDKALPLYQRALDILEVNVATVAISGKKISLVSHHTRCQQFTR
jgi:hypothetical protein